MSNDKPLVSIIVPIYNVEQYLERCLDSVVNQTYRNLEIILVNDGSTDGSEAICKEYKKKDTRIVLLKKENGGLSDARNAGMDIMKGDYVFFLDSDDYIDKETIEGLLERASLYKSDIVTTDYIPFYEKESVVYDVNKKNDYNNDLVLDSQEALENLMYQKGCKTSAWGKLYKVNLFNDIRYPKGKICEDLPTTYLLFAKSNTICITSTKYYYYLQRPNSIINSSFSVARMDALGFAEDETAFIEEYYPKIKKSAICREFLEAVYILVKLYRHNDKYKKEYSRVKRSIKKNRLVVLFDRKAPIQYRISAAMCCMSIRITQAILGRKYSDGKRKG